MATPSEITPIAKADIVILIMFLIFCLGASVQRVHTPTADKTGHGLRFFLKPSPCWTWARHPNQTPTASLIPAQGNALGLWTQRTMRALKARFTSSPFV